MFKSVPIKIPNLIFSCIVVLLVFIFLSFQSELSKDSKSDLINKKYNINGDIYSIYLKNKENYQHIPKNKADEISSLLKSDVSSIYVTQVSTESGAFDIGLISNNFFSLLGIKDFFGEDIQLNAYNQIILNYNQLNKLNNKYEIGSSISIAGNTYTVVGFSDTEFDGIGDSGELGWILFDGNESIYKDYPTVKKKYRDALFKAAPINYVFTRADKNQHFRWNQEIQSLGNTNISYFQYTASAFVKFPIDGFTFTLEPGLILDPQKYNAETVKRIGYTIISILILLFVTISYSLMQLVVVTESFRDFKIMEILGIHPQKLKTTLIVLSSVPIVASYMIYCLSMPLISLMVNDFSFSLLNVTLFSIVLILVSYSVVIKFYTSEKDNVFFSRSTISQRNRIFRNSALILQCVIIQICMFLFASSFFETKEFEDSMLGFRDDHYYFGAVQEMPSGGTIGKIQILRDASKAENNNKQYLSIHGSHPFGDPWLAQISLPSGELINSVITIVSPNYIEFTKNKLISGRNFESNNYPGIIINKVLLDLLGESTSKIVDSNIDFLIMGLPISKQVIGVVDDLRIKQPIIYINSFDTKNFYVDSDFFLIKSNENLSIIESRLIDDLKKIGWKLSEIKPLSEKIKQYTPAVNDLTSSGLYISLISLVIIIFTIFAILGFEVKQKKDELSIKRNIGAHPFYLIRENIISLFKATLISVLLYQLLYFVFIASFKKIYIEHLIDYKLMMISSSVSVIFFIFSNIAFIAISVTFIRRYVYSKNSHL